MDLSIVRDRIVTVKVTSASHTFSSEWRTDLDYLAPIEFAAHYLDVNESESLSVFEEVESPSKSPGVEIETPAA